MYEVVFPQDFEDFEWEIQSKGYFSDIIIINNGNRYLINFYDPVRFSQDVQSRIDCIGFFSEKNVAIIPMVTKENIILCVEGLITSGEINQFLIDTEF